MKKETKQDQFIIVYIHQFPVETSLVNYAVLLGKHLNKGVIFLHIADPTYTPVSPSEAEEELKTICSQSQFPISVSYASLSGITKNILESLPERLSGVLILTTVNQKSAKKTSAHPKELLKNLYFSRIAYLTLQSIPSAPSFAHILLTLDSLRESKEKVLWASYFGRFFGSHILILSEKPNDEFLRKHVENNERFSANMFNSFDIQYSFLAHEHVNLPVDKYAPAIAQQNQAKVIICQTTKDKNFIDKIIGTREEKTIINAEHIPILFLNPRTDLYVLCE